MPSSQHVGWRKVGKISVGIVMGSTSDWDVMKHVALQLKDFGVSYDARALSAHRSPDLLFEWIDECEKNGVQCFIAGAGGAAHLAGVVAAKTQLPVLAVPLCGGDAGAGRQGHG